MYESKASDKILRKATISFLLVFMLCILVSGLVIQSKINVERLTMEYLIEEKSNQARDALSRLLYKTQALVVLAVKGYDQEEFEQVAVMLIDDPAILNVIMAPDGVVTNVYPLEGNEAVMGFNLFSDGAGNDKAIEARETGQLVLEGPFLGVQGIHIMAGRMPVSITEPDGSEHFWGLVTVTLKYPQVFEAAGLNDLHIQGFDYEIWRINPDDGEKQIITSSQTADSKNPRYIEKHIVMQNADWYFRIYSTRSWYQDIDTWLLIFGGLCISFLIAYIARSNIKLKMLRLEQNAAAFQIYVSSLEQQNEIISRNAKQSALFRHDIRHVAQAMSVCVQNADLQGVAELVRHLDKNVSMNVGLVVTPFTGHNLLDSVLSAYISLARENAIEIAVKITDAENIRADKTELAVVLANALENAVQACKNQSCDVERAIRVNGQKGGEQYFLEIANTYSGEVTFDPNTALPVTNEDGHGTGSKSIAFFAEKHNAPLICEVEDGWFYLRLLIK